MSNERLFGMLTFAVVIVSMVTISITNCTRMENESYRNCIDKTGQVLECRGVRK